MKLDLIGDMHTSTQLLLVFFEQQLFFSYKL